MDNGYNEIVLVEAKKRKGKENTRKDDCMN